MSRGKGSLAPLLVLLLLPWWAGLLLGLLFPFIVAFALPIFILLYWIRLGYLFLRHTWF